jgi:hypothetical protein
MKTILKSKISGALYQLGQAKARKPRHCPTTEQAKQWFSPTKRLHLKKSGV